MKRFATGLVLAAVALGLPTALGGDDPKKPQKTPALMKQKLEASQKVLEGIALNDFEKILKNAEELGVLSRQAEWKVLKTPQYELFSNEFRRNVEGVEKAARAKNLDGATLSYVDLTLTCVRCHKYVREIRNISVDD